MKDFEIKPNFSELQREYQVDRHTIKKYYEHNGIPVRKIKKSVSKWEPFMDEIKQILEKPHVSYRALWQYLAHVHGDENLPGDYDSLRNHLWKTGIKKHVKSNSHVLYETPPGKQAQFDWKEDLKIHLVNGQEITFNVFSMTLGYSREHVFIYSSHKTTSDLIRCFIQANRKVGGICKEYLTDNMSAIVSIKGTGKKIYPQINQLFQDIGAKLNLAKVHTPQTKGKDENANKFVKWIYAYDYQVKDELELINLIEEEITSSANRQINTGTGLPPAALFEKEKEYLLPLPNRILLESYLKEHVRQTVPATQLVYYKGCRYSVSSRYINETVDLYPIGEELYIYLNQRLIAKHTISQQYINYKQADYEEGLRQRVSGKTADDITEMATENLKRLSQLRSK